MHLAYRYLAPKGDTMNIVGQGFPSGSVSCPFARNVVRAINQSSRWKIVLA
jgi:hypothetical protein